MGLGGGLAIDPAFPTASRDRCDGTTMSAWGVCRADPSVCECCSNSNVVFCDFGYRGVKLCCVSGFGCRERGGMVACDVDGFRPEEPFVVRGLGRGGGRFIWSWVLRAVVVPASCSIAGPAAAAPLGPYSKISDASLDLDPGACDVFCRLVPVPDRCDSLFVRLSTCSDWPSSAAFVPLCSPPNLVSGSLVRSINVVFLLALDCFGLVRVARRGRFVIVAAGTTDMSSLSCSPANLKNSSSVRDGSPNGGGT